MYSNYTLTYIYIYIYIRIYTGTNNTLIYMICDKRGVGLIRITV